MGGKEYVIDKIDNNTKTLTINAHEDSGDPWPSGTTVRRLRPANGAGASKINVANAALLYNNAIVELDNGSTKEINLVKGVNGNAVEFTRTLQGTYTEGNKIRVVEAEISARQIVDGQIVKEEVFSNLQLKDNNDLYFLPTNIKTLATLIEIGSLGPGFPKNERS